LTQKALKTTYEGYKENKVTSQRSVVTTSNVINKLPVVVSYIRIWQGNI
jgi:hypothetical protein